MSGPLQGLIYNENSPGKGLEQYKIQVGHEGAAPGQNWESELRVASQCHVRKEVRDGPSVFLRGRESNQL